MQPNQRAPVFAGSPGEAAPAPMLPQAPSRALPGFAPVKDLEGSQRALALGFALSLCCFFAAPTILAWQLGSDPDVQFWIGSEGRLSVLVPVFFLLTYIYHLHRISQGTPPRRLFIFPILLPAILFCLLGAHHVYHSANLYAQLKSPDCSGHGGFLHEKKNLQQAYTRALGIYNTCLQRMVDQNGGTELHFRPTLQSCAEWEVMSMEAPEGKVLEDDPKAYSQPKDDAEHLPWHAYPIRSTSIVDESESMKQLENDPIVTAQWSYLANAEANHICGGFCEPGPALWNHFDTTGRLGGPCANFIAHKFEIVRHHGLLILWTNLACVVVSSAMYHTSRKVLAELGYF